MGEKTIRSGMFSALGALTIYCFAPSLPAGASSDWPTYRCDSQRSGYTAETLPADLSLAWVYRARHAPRPAWPGRDTRMPFDRAYQTVIAGETLFFGSSADCKVYALDIATGVEKWTFFTGGPVRFAPAVWEDRVFVVSDDGVLYCLGAKDGRLLWKRRGGPVDSMILGNDRMISRWPARGGPVIADGVVHFAAGIWPSEGIYIYALDARTGNRLWVNNSSGGLVMLQPHNAKAKSGVSAQGDLVLVGDRLLVPTGRGVPAAFRRSDGKFLYFHLARYRRYGGSAVVGGGSLFFNGGQIFDVLTGNRLPGGVGASAVAVTPKDIVYAAGNEIVALDRAKMWTQKETVDRTGKKSTKTALSSPTWRIESPYKKARSLIVAGEMVIVGGSNSTTVIDMRSQKTLLTAKVDGVPYGLAVAHGRLFVSTDRGTIYCFDGNAVGEAKVIATKSLDFPYGDNDPFAAAAKEIIKRTGLTEGYCLDLACGDGALTYALARRSKLQIYAIDSDPEKVAIARKKLDGAGLYGVRVTVHQGDPGATGYPNYFANLIVSGRSVTEGPGVVPGKEMYRLQRPYGGAICIGRPGAMRKEIRGELPGAGTWTHQYCSPGNTNCSTDRVARGPLGVLWFTDFDFQMPNRHGRGPAPLFLDGRLFVEGVNALRCTDAYNGRTLWKYPLLGILKAYDQEHLMGVAGTGSNFCVTAQGVYVRTGGKCLKIDPTSGKLQAEFEAPGQDDGRPGTWGYIACEGGILYGSLADKEHVVKYHHAKSDMSKLFTESRYLFAMDAATGEVKWDYRARGSIRHNAIAVGSGRVYLIDRPAAEKDLLQRPKPSDEHQPGVLIALDAETGGRQWRATEDIYGTVLSLSKEHDVLLMSYLHTRFRLPSETGGRLTAFRASDGERLWDVKADYGSRPILNGRTIYAQPGAWDLLTGREKEFRFRRSYGCGTLAGSKNLLTFRSATLGYRDLLHDHGTENYGGIRPGCWINAIPAGGLVLMPDASDRCTCSYLIKASIALQPYGIRPPRISPNGGISHKPIMVKLIADTKDLNIYYTLDGSVPTTSAKQYIGPIEISKSTKLKVRSFARGLPPSQINVASFTIDPHLLPLKGPAWSVYDSPGARPSKSKWEVTDGVVTELSNLYAGNAKDDDPGTERPGTFRIYSPGGNFTDGELTLQLAASDDGVLGVAFRFSGPDRHYVWAMAGQRGFHVLACKNGGSYRVLARSAGGYERKRWYVLRVLLKGPNITVYLNGRKDLEATDATFGKGTFALYAWRCKGAKFRNARWKQ